MKKTKYLFKCIHCGHNNLIAVNTLFDTSKYYTVNWICNRCTKSISKLFCDNGYNGEVDVSWFCCLLIIGDGTGRMPPQDTATCPHGPSNPSYMSTMTHIAPPSRLFVAQSNREAVLQSAFSDLLPKDIKRPSEAVLSLLEPSNKRRKHRWKTIESVTS